MSKQIQTARYLSRSGLILAVNYGAIAIFGLAVISVGIAGLSRNILVFEFGLTCFILSFVSTLFKEHIRKLNKPLFENSFYDIFAPELSGQLLKSKALNLENLLLALTYSKIGSNFFLRLGFKATEFRKILGEVYPDINDNLKNTFTDNHAQILFNEFTALKLNTKTSQIDSNLLLFHLNQIPNFLTPLLNHLDISAESFHELINQSHQGLLLPKPKTIWDPNYIIDSSEVVGRNWVLGYAKALENVTVDLSTSIVQRRFGKFIIHTETINQIFGLLSSQRKNNILLLGNPGSGGSTLVENIAFLMRQTQKLHSQAYTRVLKLNTVDLLYSDLKAENYLLDALNAAEQSGHIILVIENVSSIMHLQNSQISSVIGKFLNSGRITVIALDTLQNYYTSIKGKSSLDQNFSKVNIAPATDYEIWQLLWEEVFINEKSIKTKFTFQALKTLLDLTKQYLPGMELPGKALKLVSESIVEAQQQGSSFVIPSHVTSVIGKAANIDFERLSPGKNNKLVDLEGQIQKEVIGQDDAIKTVVNSLKRASSGLGSRKKPIGTFLFLGTTGVGKTETAKSLAKHYFGSEQNMIRLDMNNFSLPESTIYITGGEVNGVFQESELIRQVQQQPFSLILLDEMEKAHKNVLNTLLQILDEGQLTDATGQKTSFKDCIIIATSNAGAMFISSYLIKRMNSDTDNQTVKKELLDELVKTNLYSPEFLNRFDEICIYYPLSAQSAAGLAQKLVQSLAENIYTTRGFILQVEPAVIEHLGKIGYSPEYGAREMKRTIQNILESYLANYLIKHAVHRGENITVRLSDLVN